MHTNDSYQIHNSGDGGGVEWAWERCTEDFDYIYSFISLKNKGQVRCGKILRPDKAGWWLQGY